MQPLLNIGVRAARRAGDIIVRNINRLDSIKISSKGRNDFVSEVDRQAEADIIATVRRSYPDHAFLAEETGRQGDSEFVWIIDPLDGTTNFLHGFPVFAVSLALSHRGRMEHGVVYDPMRQELFTASRGEGAQRMAANPFVQCLELTRRQFIQPGGGEFPAGHLFLERGEAVGSQQRGGSQEAEQNEEGSFHGRHLNTRNRESLTWTAKGARRFHRP